MITADAVNEVFSACHRRTGLTRQSGRRSVSVAKYEVDRRGHCKSRFPTEINEKSYPEVGKDKHPTPDIIK